MIDRSEVWRLGSGADYLFNHKRGDGRIYRVGDIAAVPENQAGEPRSLSYWIVVDEHGAMLALDYGFDQPSPGLAAAWEAAVAASKAASDLPLNPTPLMRSKTHQRKMVTQADLARAIKAHWIAQQVTK